MPICIVIARYNEDIEWSEQFLNVVIYNKGCKLESNKMYNEVLLDNVGREGHTYYKYICDNYDNLEDYIVFLQGTPFDHSPNIIQNLWSIINNIDSLPLHNGFGFLSELLLCCNLDGSCEPYVLPLVDTYKRLFDEEKNSMEFVFGQGAQFIVSKQKILERPREFYLKIVKMLEYGISPIEGYVIERFHGVIFGVL